MKFNRFKLQSGDLTDAREYSYTQLSELKNDIELFKLKGGAKVYINYLQWVKIRHIFYEKVDSDKF